MPVNLGIFLGGDFFSALLQGGGVLPPDGQTFVAMDLKSVAAYQWG